MVWFRIGPDDQARIREQLEWAREHGKPVTVSFLEHVRDSDNTPLYMEPDPILGIKDRRPVLRKVTRTVEPYEPPTQNTRGEWYVRVMDRKPRLSGPLGYDVRTIRLDRILRTRKRRLFTVHVKGAHIVPNPWKKGGPLYRPAG